MTRQALGGLAVPDTHDPADLHLAVADRLQSVWAPSSMFTGGIVNLSDSTFRMTGNAHLVVDRDNADDHPAGITTHPQLACVTGSDEE